MAPIRQALVTIFAREQDPLQTIIDCVTVNQYVLSHSPVVVVHKERATGRTQATQVVYSAPRSHPWGIIPKCPDATCKGEIGSAFGKMNRSVASRGTHVECRYTCNSCNTVSDWIQRPTWIQPVTHRPFYFTMPFPVSPRMIAEARGHCDRDGNEVRAWKRRDI